MNGPNIFQMFLVSVEVSDDDLLSHVAAVTSTGNNPWLVK